MQRRWENSRCCRGRQLPVLSLGNTTSRWCSSSARSSLPAFSFRRQAGHRRQLVGRRARGLHHSGWRVSALVLVSCSFGRIFTRRACRSALGDILNTTAEPTYTPARVAAAIGNINLTMSFRYRIDGREVPRCQLRCAGRQMVGIVGPSGSGKSYVAKLVQRLYVLRGARLVDGMISPWSTFSLAAPPDRRRPAGERPVQPSGAREYRARRPAMPMSASSRRRPAGRTNSSWSWKAATITIVDERGSTFRWPAPAHRHCPGALDPHSDLR